MTLSSIIVCYGCALLATSFKTVAWWLNQWIDSDAESSNTDNFTNITITNTTIDSNNNNYSFNGAAFSFFVTWSFSVMVAAAEYAPLTISMQHAGQNGVHMGLLTAFMECVDNFCRVLQQVALALPVDAIDWAAAAIMIMAVIAQAIAQRRREEIEKQNESEQKEEHEEEQGEGKLKRREKEEETNEVEMGEGGLGAYMNIDAHRGGSNIDNITDHSDSTAIDNNINNIVNNDNNVDVDVDVDVNVDDKDNDDLNTATLSHKPLDGADVSDITLESATLSSTPRFALPLLLSIFVFLLLLVLLIVLSHGSPLLLVYALATLCTYSKTFAWWSSQYPVIVHLSFCYKWLIGWSVAALAEYVPLLAAFKIASTAIPKIHLGIMTAYMEVLDNALRMLQQKALKKQVHWTDVTAALVMAAAVIMQAGLHYLNE